MSVSEETEASGWPPARKLLKIPFAGNSKQNRSKIRLERVSEQAGYPDTRNFGKKSETFVSTCSGQQI
jgi:hypothetical protein